MPLPTTREGWKEEMEECTSFCDYDAKEVDAAFVEGGNDAATAKYNEICDCIHRVRSMNYALNHRSGFNYAEGSWL